MACLVSENQVNGWFRVYAGEFGSSAPWADNPQPSLYTLAFT